MILLTIDEQDKPDAFINDSRVTFVVCPLDSLATINPSRITVKQVDAFLHLAWVGTSGILRADEKVQIKNVEYACDAVRLAKKLGCSRFVNAGSIMEYEAFYTLTKSGMKSNPNMMYSIGKLAEDLSCKTVSAAVDIAYCNVVIGNIYGVGEQSQRFINVMLKKLLSLLLCALLLLLHILMLSLLLWEWDMISALLNRSLHSLLKYLQMRPTLQESLRRNAKIFSSAVLLLS